MPNPYIDVRLGDVPSKDGVTLKSAKVVRSSPDLAIVKVEVAGKNQGLRFDTGKQVFFDSLGDAKLDRAVDSLRGPLTARLVKARQRRTPVRRAG